MQTKKILLLEDDANLNETVTDYLQEQGYEVVSVYDGHEAEEMIYESSYDLLLLDVNTPGMSGFEVLSLAREQGIKTPAIYITSLDGVEDLERGYDSGCDDYIRKPFALRELHIRMEALLQREFYHSSKEYIDIDTNIKYSLKSGELLVDDTTVNLGSKESALLKLFLQSNDEVATHEKIMNTLWGYEQEPSEASVRTYIKNLRKIIGKERIVSIKKQGYRYSSRK